MDLACDSSTKTLKRLLGALRELSPLCPDEVDRLTDDLEVVLGLGSPVSGASSWSARTGPGSGQVPPDDFLVLIPRMRGWLDHLVTKATSWDAADAADDIAQARDLASRCVPATTTGTQGLLRLMAIAAMDLLDRLDPSP